MSDPSYFLDPALAAQLIKLARRVRRLPPPSRRWPDRFTEDKDDIAAVIEALVRRHCPSAVRPPQPSAISQRRVRGVRPVPPRTITIGSRRVIVQVRRAAFSLG